LPALTRRTILVTRPQGRADRLCQLIDEAGGHAIHYPVIEILPPHDNSSLANIKTKLDQFEIAIFISPTTVSKTASLLPLFPEPLKVAAIGSKTAALLEQHGVVVSIQADGHNSESLLTHPLLQADAVKDLNIVIFRGEGGRAFLGDQLSHRGAHIHYVESYRRALPDVSTLPDDILDTLDAITISSNEGLDNLMQLLRQTLDTQAATILSVPIIVASDKTVKNAQSYGFSTVLRAKNATDEACFEQLEKLFNK